LPSLLGSICLSLPKSWEISQLNFLGKFCNKKHIAICVCVRQFPSKLRPPCFPRGPRALFVSAGADHLTWISPISPTRRFLLRQPRSHLTSNLPSIIPPSPLPPFLRFLFLNSKVALSRASTPQCPITPTLTA
jgi:hypothetical protein